MNPTTPQPIALAPSAEDDELARAELYGLLAQLWIGPPDATLLARFGTVDTSAHGGALDAPWQALVETMRHSDCAAAADEYDALFLGVGKPELMLYGSYHLSGFLHEQPLADLRSDLQRLGLARDENRHETEDHVAYVFEVMRYLIAGDDAAVCNLEQQRRFFRHHVQPWVETMCASVAAHPRAQVWRAVADFTAAFMRVETQGFDLLES